MYQQRSTLLRSTLGIVFSGIGGQHLAHVVRQQGAVAEPAQLLQHHTGHQAGGQHRQGHRGNLEEEVAEVPAHLVANQQVLRLAHQGADATQRGADSAMHQQAAQEGAKLLQVVALQLGDVVIAIEVRLFPRVGARGDPVVHRVETHRRTDDHRGNGQGIEKRREKGRKKAEQQGQQRLGAHPEENPREHEQQQILHEIDAGNHEHQQQDHREIVLQLVIQRLGRGHAQHQGLGHQQATRHQRVALERHAQGKDELDHQHPTGDHRPEGDQQQRVEQQEQAQGGLVPAGRLPEEVMGQGAGQGAGHVNVS
ncbi:hypothetical protein D3C78_763600 [compost metagenome]